MVIVCWFVLIEFISTCPLLWFVMQCSTQIDAIRVTEIKNGFKLYWLIIGIRILLVIFFTIIFSSKTNLVTSSGQLLIVQNIVRNGSLWSNVFQIEVISHSNNKRLELKHDQEGRTSLKQWVRSFSFPESTPVCGGFFSQDECMQIITHVRPGKKNTPRTGVDQEELNERTQRCVVETLYLYHGTKPRQRFASLQVAPFFMFALQTMECSQKLHQSLTWYANSRSVSTISYTQSNYCAQWYIGALYHAMCAKLTIGYYRNAGSQWMRGAFSWLRCRRITAI